MSPDAHLSLEYDSGSIALAGAHVAFVRKRPGMYIGNLHDGTALHHALWEVVANSLDQFLAGRCRRVEVVLHEAGWVTVSDDGPGIPISLDEAGISFVESILTRIHLTPTRDQHVPHVHAERFGVGMAPINAVCEELVVEIRRDGQRYVQTYRQGRPISALENTGLAESTGTTLKFKPDPLIFAITEFSHGRIEARLRELAFLCPGVGSHIAGLWAAVQRVFRKYHIPAPKTGLHGLLHVKLADPNFANPTKDKLDTPEAKNAVFEVVNRFLDTFFAAHPEVVAKLTTRLF
jgi:DNA gyrase/topoisomerase IV subunit B